MWLHRTWVSKRAVRGIHQQCTGKHEWLVILPDREGALEKRVEVRGTHLKALEPLVKRGFWTFGGAILERAPEEGKQLQMKGSVMLAQAESKEAVLEVLKEDTYYKSGVWDWEKVQVYPFRTALRQPLA